MTILVIRTIDGNTHKWINAPMPSVEPAGSPVSVLWFSHTKVVEGKEVSTMYSFPLSSIICWFIRDCEDENMMGCGCDFHHHLPNKNKGANNG